MKLLPFVFLISNNLFSYEVFNSVTNEYFPVRGCTPIENKLSRVEYEGCDKIKKIISQGLCTNLNNRCDKIKADLSEENSKKATLYTKPQGIFESAHVEQINK